MESLDQYLRNLIYTQSTPPPASHESKEINTEKLLTMYDLAIYGNEVDKFVEENDIDSALRNHEYADFGKAFKEKITAVKSVSAHATYLMNIGEVIFPAGEGIDDKFPEKFWTDMSVRMTNPDFVVPAPMNAYMDGITARKTDKLSELLTRIVEKKNEDATEDAPLANTDNTGPIGIMYNKIVEKNNGSGPQLGCNG